MTNELRPLTSAIHAEIRSWMKKKNLSQRQLAEKAGISKSKISRIIGTGEQAIDINELDAVCQVLGISTEVLVLEGCTVNTNHTQEGENHPMADPYTLAHTLGLPIIHTPLPKGVHGLYQGTHIALRPGLTTREERTVLAHELKHAQDGQTHLPHHIAPRIEAACDLYAAELLINPQELHTLATLYPDDPGRIAYELNVADWALNAYIRAHPLHLLEDNHAA